jgi:hypothetical protein
MTSIVQEEPTIVSGPLQADDHPATGEVVEQPTKVRDGGAGIHEELQWAGWCLDNDRSTNGPRGCDGEPRSYDGDALALVSKAVNELIEDSIPYGGGLAPVINGADYRDRLARLALARKLWDACETLGFLLQTAGTHLRGHDLDAAEAFLELQREHYQRKKDYFVASGPRDEVVDFLSAEEGGWDFALEAYST